MTWDGIRSDFGPDVEAIDETLNHVFAEYEVQADKIAVGGFSDGGSYALTLGLTNGDLFRDIIAFSPGFIASGRPTGRPRVYISHGRNDAILLSRTVA